MGTGSDKYLHIFFMAYGEECIQIIIRIFCAKIKYSPLNLMHTPRNICTDRVKSHFFYCIKDVRPQGTFKSPVVHAATERNITVWRTIWQAWICVVWIAYGYGCTSPKNNNNHAIKLIA